VLITLVTPLHRPGSANVVPSVCVYRKQERALSCQPIVRPCTTAGLGSAVPGIRGRSAITPPPRGTARLHFDMCAMVLETQPLPAVSRAHSPAKLTDCPAASDVGGLQFLGPSSGADRPLCFPSRAPTLAPPGRFVMFRPFHRLLCRLGPRIGRERHRGPASDHLPPVPHQRSNSDHAGKRYVLGQNRESRLRLVRELRLSTWECDFAGINIPSMHTCTNIFKLQVVAC